MLSYSHLPPRLKQCFAYCAMIPKGETMRIETLAQLWVAEGLADLEDVGSQYVDQLLSRSLLEIGQGEEHGAVGLVKMHDVVHDLARLVAGDECSIIGVCGSTATTPGSRYASLLIDGRTPSVAETLSHMRKLRALYVIKTAGDQDEGERVLRAIFSTMKPLRALHLHGFAMKALPAAVQKLDHLRYLDLSGTDLRKLPPAIGRLHNLQILKLRNCPRLEALPESIGELVNLVTLDLCFFLRLSSLPDSIGRLQNLQILKLTFCMELEALPESIGELVNLVTLDLYFCRRLSYLPDSIGRMGNLQILNLRHCMKLEALPESIGELVNLVTLDLYFCRRLSYLPDSIGRMGNLQILNLRRCPGLEALPESIGELVNLVTLDLCFCQSLSSLPDSIGRMGNLRNLDVSKTCITTLPESLSSLSNLQLLKLRDCHRLNELPKNVPSMRSLTHLDIHGCVGLTRMPAGLGQLRQLRMLPRYVLGDGDGDGGLEELGTLNLEGELYIGNLRNLRSAAEAGEANLREKRGLRSLSLNWDLACSLQQEDRNDVAAMGGEHTELVEDALGSLRPQPDLEELRIEGYEGKVLPGWMMDCAIPNLVELSLDAFIRCEKLPALERLSCLKVLNLSRFPCVEWLPRLGQLPCLRVLRLEGLPAVKRLGSEFYGGGCAFPALEELRLVFMSDLEEWSGTEGEDFLPRLWELEPTDCPKLGALPSTFPSVNSLTMYVDDKLLLSHHERGAFPNLVILSVISYGRDVEAGIPEVITKRWRATEISSLTGRRAACPRCSAALESVNEWKSVGFAPQMME